MNLSFTKMQGLGNDFIVLDQRHQSIRLTKHQIRSIADRRYGVGFDQMLCIEPATAPSARFRVRIFNADGGRAEQCGNGVRCVARYLEWRNLVNRDKFVIQSGRTLIEIRLERDGSVSCGMGVPEFAPAKIPFIAKGQSTYYDLVADGVSVSLGVVSIGNPHAVVEVDDIDTAPVARMGSVLEHHSAFPNRVNVGFMKVGARDHIQLRVHERGVGETRACGTGACAAVVVARMRGQLDERVSVELTGGTLQITWRGDASPVWMNGPATWVFEGNIDV